MWQMQDPSEDLVTDGEGAQKWLNLPRVMAAFADKSYAKYQVDLHEGRERHAGGEINAAKYQKIVDDAKKILVLMHTTGQPATNKYIQEHMVQVEGGGYKLKTGSRSTLIIFDFKEAKVKVGAYSWTPLRVLKAETKFQGIHLEAGTAGI